LLLIIWSDLVDDTLVAVPRAAVVDAFARWSGPSDLRLIVSKVDFKQNPGLCR
jgi:hypothetical protein